MPETSLLFVDPNEDERDVYAAGLPVYGFRVHCLNSLDGLEAAVERARPEALVMNLRLGDDETWGRLEALQFGAALNVPGILLTGSIRTDAANRTRAMAHGCAAFVVKPCAPNTLASILRAVLAGERGLVVMRPEQFPASAEGEPKVTGG